MGKSATEKSGKQLSLFLGVACLALAGCQCLSGGKGAGELQQKTSWDLPGENKLEMVFCPAGSFTMGSPEAELERDADEKQHQVTLTQPFAIGKYEVTQKQYMAVMGVNPSNFRGDNLPVENVSWHEAVAFCTELNALTEGERPEGYQFTLPTEAQWEYACRAGAVTAWNNGKDIQHKEAADAELDKVAWNYYNAGKQTHPVGQKAPNAWGIYDMQGNVWEWCLDWQAPYQGDVTDPLVNADKKKLEHIARGGSWYYGIKHCRAAYRDSLMPCNHDCDLGFRVVLTPFSAEKMEAVLHPPVPVKPAAKPAAKPVAKPTVKPAAKPAVQPAAKPVAKPTAQPAAKPVAKPAVQPAAKPVAKPTAQPAAKPVAKPAVQPVAKPAVQPVAKPAVQPVAKPVAKPAVQPAAKPVEKPAVTPVAPATETSEMKITK